MLDWQGELTGSAVRGTPTAAVRVNALCTYTVAVSIWRVREDARAQKHTAHLPRNQNTTSPDKLGIARARHFLTLQPSVTFLSDASDGDKGSQKELARPPLSLPAAHRLSPLGAAEWGRRQRYRLHNLQACVEDVITEEFLKKRQQEHPFDWK